MMICSYMLYENMWETADESMTFYAAMRTYNRKVYLYLQSLRRFGITFQIPSNFTFNQIIDK